MPYSISIQFNILIFSLASCVIAIGDPLGDCRVTPYGYSVMLKNQMHVANYHNIFCLCIWIAIALNYSISSVATLMIGYFTSGSPMATALMALDLENQAIIEFMDGNFEHALDLSTQALVLHELSKIYADIALKIRSCSCIF